MGIVDEILEEIYKRTDKMLWHIAQTSNIPGYDADDLMQEMRIKIWKVIEDNKYDPEMCQETTFFYSVCKRHLRGLYRSKIYAYNTTEPKRRQCRDICDQKDTGSYENVAPAITDPIGFISGLSADFIRDQIKNTELENDPNIIEYLRQK